MAGLIDCLEISGPIDRELRFQAIVL